MNTTTTRTIAALAATGALVAGGAAAASATNGDSDHTRSTGESASAVKSEVTQLVQKAVEDGVVTVKEEDAIKQAIADHSDLKFESLGDAVPQG
jgi:dienelactone hydrolase